jgi:hypothetical protein
MPIVNENQSQQYCVRNVPIPNMVSHPRHNAATDAVADADPLGSQLMTAPVLTLVSTPQADSRAALVSKLDAMLDAPFVPTREQPCQRMRDRGIYIANWLGPCGNPIIQAIGSDRRLKAWLPWTEGRSLAEVVDELTFVLDRVEKRPSPRLTTIVSAAVALPLSAVVADLLGVGARFL